MLSLACAVCRTVFTSQRAGVVKCPQCGSLKTSPKPSPTHDVREGKSESGRRRLIFTPKAQDYTVKMHCLMCTHKFDTRVDPYNRYQCPKCASTELVPCSPQAAVYAGGDLPQAPLTKAEIKRLRFILNNYRMIVEFRANIDSLASFMERAAVPEPLRVEAVHVLERCYTALDKAHQIKLDDYEKARNVLNASGEAHSG